MVTPHSERTFPCCKCCEGVALGDHIGNGGWIAKNGHDIPCDSCDREAALPQIAQALLDAANEMQADLQISEFDGAVLWLKTRAERYLRDGGQ